MPRDEEALYFQDTDKIYNFIRNLAALIVEKQIDSICVGSIKIVNTPKPKDPQDSIRVGDKKLTPRQLEDKILFGQIIDE